MPGINEFYPFAAGVGADVISQSEYGAQPSLRANGFTTGTAYSNQLNKVWRQSTVVAATIGQIIADAGGDALDDGNLLALQNALVTALVDTLGPLILGALTYDKLMIVREQQSVGVNAGGAVTGVNLRALNNIVFNNITGATLGSNQITLPAGTYELKAVTSSFGVKFSQPLLYNVTDAAIQDVGISANGNLNSDPDPVQVLPTITTRFTIASPKVFELRLYCSQDNPTNGLGKAVGYATEVYSLVEIKQINLA